MTSEGLLITAITAVVSALCYVCNLLWQRSGECEKDRREMRTQIDALNRASGLADGTLQAYQRCHVDECPFRPGDEQGPPKRIAAHSSLDPC